MILETERLILRNWRESDVDCYMTLSRDLGYNCFARPGYFLVRNAEEAREKIRERTTLFDERRLGKFPIFLKQSGEFIGTCGMEPFDLDGQAEIELGYRICLNYWGCGYATESAAAVLRYGFDDLNLKKIFAMAVPQNKGSLHVIEKLGFRYLRDFMYKGWLHRLHEMTRGNVGSS
jgi:RimJ/RimL family protein N-acetyltransferase